MTYVYFLNDTLKTLISRALELDTENGDDFHKGILFGYYEAISHLLNQAEVFEISKTLDSYLQHFEAEGILTQEAKPPFDKG